MTWDVELIPDGGDSGDSNELSTGQKWAIVGGFSFLVVLVAITALYRFCWYKPRLLKRESQC